MTEPGGGDHDQRLKVLLKEFFEGFFVCFFPEWAQRFEFLEIDWLDKELFLAPPQGVSGDTKTDPPGDTKTDPRLYA